jgi:hypothetical protein
VKAAEVINSMLSIMRDNGVRVGVLSPMHGMSIWARIQDLCYSLVKSWLSVVRVGVVQSLPRPPILAVHDAVWTRIKQVRCKTILFASIG